MSRLTWCRRPAGAEGSIAPLVPIMGLMMLLLGGVVIDGSRLLNARGRAVAYAEEAARAGAGAIVLGSLTLALDEPLARERVDAYCASLRSDAELQSSIETCELDANGPTDNGIEAVGNGDGRRIVVRVRVSMRIRTSLIGILGVQELTARGTSRARPFEGATRDDVDSEPPPVDPAPDGPVGPPGGVGAGDGLPEVDPGVVICPPGPPSCPPPCPPGTVPGTPACPLPVPVPVLPSTAPPASPSPTASPSPSPTASPPA